MSSTKTLTLVCGGWDYSPKPNETFVYVSPITAWQVCNQNHSYFTLLGDYSPSEVLARAADELLYHQVETCLHLEAKYDLQRRWWPLAYRRVTARLSRYRWLKFCLKSALERSGAVNLRLTSGEDQDLVMAASAVVQQLGVSIEVLNDRADSPLNFDHMIRQTGLPMEIDPIWLTRVMSVFWRFYSSIKPIGCQPYWNLDLSDCENFCPVLINRVVSLFETIRAKIGLRNVSGNRHQSSYYDLWSQDLTPEHLSEMLWNNFFTKDERILVARIMGTFVREYPNMALDRAGEAIKSYIKSRGINKIILMHDKLDSCRLLAWAAHEVGVKVDYLPHGIIFEDASSRATGSPFSPDRILAWNSDSAKIFKKYGWAVDVVAHPHFQKEVSVFKNLKKNWGDTRVLILLADWVYLTQAGREDCAWVWYRDILDVLHELGAKDENILIKMHQFGKDLTEGYEKIASTIAQKMDFKPRWVAQSSRLSEVLPTTDIVICGLTTGIYECAINGVPCVVYGMSASRVGAVGDGVNIPYARDKKGLMNQLSSFDNDLASQASSMLRASLKAGKKIVDIY